MTDLMAQHGHEQVVFVADAEVGLRAVIAIHSTALGPALGGVRFWHYDTDTDALLDALRLSEAMSLKASIAGLHQGGGKAVVRWDDPDRARPPELLDALGRAIDELGGRYLAAEDVGATPADMDGLARVTPWVTGVDESMGGSGDPSPVTAFGVARAMRAVCRELDGDPTLRGRARRRTGCRARRRPSGAPARRRGRARHRRRSARGARRNSSPRRSARVAIDADAALDAECDILAPCALGQVFDDTTIPRLRCRAIVGAANNQLAGPALDGALAGARDLYAPDFVVNAGGIINIAEEFVGYDRDRALAHAAGIEATTTEVFRFAREHRLTTTAGRRNRSPNAASPRRATDVVGSPAILPAWTNGEPLVRLRQ